MRAVSAARSTRWAPSGVVALALLAGAGALWSAATTGDTLADGWRHAPAAFAVAVAAYLAAHAVRVLRMLVVLGDSAGSVRGVAFAHAATAPAGLLPFKIGEVVRLWAIGNASGGFAQGLRAVWVERTFDAAAIAAVGAVALGTVEGARAAVLPVVVVALLWLAATGAVLFVLPENVGMAKRWLIRRYTETWTIRALAGLHALGGELRTAQGLVRGKVATLTVLTAVVWTLEGAALWLVLPRVDDLVTSVVAGMLAALSDAFLPVGRSVDGLVEAVAVHRLVVFGTVDAIGFVALAAAAVLGPRALSSRSSSSSTTSSSGRRGRP